MVVPAEPSVFRETLGFFDKIGVYDVVLPFLLVFTLVYAILEKTKIFGTERFEGKGDLTKKNLNGMTAFVVAFFVIASTRLVAIINEVLAHTVLLLLLSICFLLLAGSFHSGKDEFHLEKKWKTFFMIIMFIGIVLIFLNALGWLQVLYEQLFFKFDTIVVSSIVLIGVIVLFIVYVTGGFAKKDKAETSD
ncbi:MAG: hypothetical protein KJ685_00005 [Nanoarchaeota archaeon]|nr:hypothetical protein [Nanoarchaeota archaeon]